MSDAPTSDVWVVALGVRVRIVAEPPVASALRAAWASCLAAPDADARFVVAADEVRSLTGATSEEEHVQRIPETVTAGAIRARAGELLMVHACAVANPRTGAVVVLVGPSGMGKTGRPRARASRP